MHPRPALHRLALTLLLLSTPALANTVPPHPTPSAVDTDADGLPDALEQALLVQFAPTFRVGQDDCSHLPAEFQPNLSVPSVVSEDGAIYGQVSPAHDSTASAPAVEIHFFHLWRVDCGPRGHPLDTEHVAVLVRASSPDLATATWKADLWYAAAHENTVCDVSQIARASTLHAEDHGAQVWISPGKHASYLNETLCRRGCGADRCERMAALPAGPLINLGEPGHPMNGSAFIASARWPLAGKMSTSNFADEPVSRLRQLPATDIAWVLPGRHPVQQIISNSNSTETALATSTRNTSTAISVAQGSTGNALGRSFRNTRHALGASAHHVGEALHVTPPADPVH